MRLADAITVTPSAMWCDGTPHSWSQQSSTVSGENVRCGTGAPGDGVEGRAGAGRAAANDEDVERIAQCACLELRQRVLPGGHVLNIEL
jgi:hypothetical protein